MNAHILIIDDEALWVDNLAFILQRKKYRVSSARSGVEGLKLLAATPHAFDIILLDLMMPEMDGLGVMLALSKDIVLSHIPVILQTGTVDPVPIEQAFKLGARDCLKKPYGYRELLAAIETTLQNEEALNRSEVIG